jgi:hypothetical protein
MDSQEHGFLQWRKTMRLFDVQAIEIGTSRERLFDFVRDPGNLPRWAHAFQSADHQRARLQTPSGKVDIGLLTEADSQTGTVDWRLEFPDKSIALAQSRVTETTRGTCIYSFVLHAPPVPLEQVEGALEQQSAMLRQELSTLKSLMER